jgi:hypothetical protein
MPRAAATFENSSAQDVMSQLLNKGYQTFLLSGALIDQFSDGIVGYVEEDIQFLLDEYLGLENLIAKPGPFAHRNGILIGDGVLGLAAESNRETVHIEFRYCPQSDVKNLLVHQVEISEAEYVAWWRSIAHGVLKYAL